jgi:cytochrome bd-type quinol oxidase subunit 2
MASGQGHNPAHHDDHAHAGPKLYWIFAAILCFITFIEWIIFKKKEDFGISNSLMIWTLLILSVVKFVMVCGWYMHLRFDNKMLTQIFVFSGLLAFGVFVILKLSLPSVG